MFEDSKAFIERLKETWWRPHQVNGKVYDPLKHEFVNGGYGVPHTDRTINVDLTLDDIKNLRALMAQLQHASVKGVDCPKRYELICDYLVMFETYIPYEEFERLHK